MQYIIELNGMQNTSEVMDYKDLIEKHFQTDIATLVSIVRNKNTASVLNLYIVEKLFEIFTSDEEKNAAYEIACFIPLLYQNSSTKFRMKNFVELSSSKSTTFSRTEDASKVAWKFIILCLCLGIINCNTTNVLFPSIGINGYSTQNAIEQKLIFLSKISKYLENPNLLSLDRIISSLEITVSDTFVNTVSVYCTNYNVGRHIDNEVFTKETQKLLEKQSDEIKSLHLKIIEIVSIIIAVFSIIGINVFSLSRSEEKIIFENIILIDLTLILSIVVLFGLISWIIKKEELPKGFFVLAISLLVLIIIFSICPISDKLDIIYNVYVNLIK